MEASPCANTHLPYVQPLSFPFPLRLRSHRSMLRLGLEVSTWVRGTIVTIATTIKTKVVAAENYVQRACTRKN
jgi:hypothetical protein